MRITHRGTKLSQWGLNNFDICESQRPVFFEYNMKRQKKELPLASTRVIWEDMGISFNVLHFWKLWSTTCTQWSDTGACEKQSELDSKHKWEEQIVHKTSCTLIISKIFREKFVFTSRSDLSTCGDNHTWTNSSELAHGTMVVRTRKQILSRHSARQRISKAGGPQSTFKLAC